MDIVAKLLSTNIKKARKAKGWTQTDLAVESGVSFGAIQSIEAGIRNPRPDTLAAIAGALGVNPESLYAKPKETQTLQTAPNGSPSAIAELVVKQLLEKGLRVASEKPERLYSLPPPEPKPVTKRQALIKMIRRLSDFEVDNIIGGLSPHHAELFRSYLDEQIIHKIR